MKNQFTIYHRKPNPIDEQETIITYDKVAKAWRVYTDNPVHARKYESLVIAGDEFSNSKVYHSDTGELIGIEGTIDGSVNIRKKMVLSQKEKEIRAERMREMLKATQH